jgi:hypothetical protein
MLNKIKIGDLIRCKYNSKIIGIIFKKDRMLKYIEVLWFYNDYKKQTYNEYYARDNFIKL